MTAFSYRTVTCHVCHGSGFVTGTFGGGEYRCDDCCGLGWVCGECSGCDDESPLNSEGMCAECAAVVETVGDPMLRKDAA